ncbi:hypothetical protein BDV95DRAFT_128174 [Massariosphaeria phaeospora]|uniref:Retrovirus-related Pol polyprotein from transposon TNT 1-94-like beta-barrel domain-containing protein n=1 Tax=Massariosphaeria phaeospora TaxID=100035 RepID=A0A7C8M4V2_9PLEO|nr:hypothetical protein BDV95DRAFT_128174 [Massariosphaeria phaeospora]
MASSSSDRLCPDWVFAKLSNVHLCKDRGWFTDYIPFHSFVMSTNAKNSVFIGDEERQWVAGIGTVALPVKKSPGRTGSGTNVHLVLHNVVHCPSLICNVFSNAAASGQGYSIDLTETGKTRGKITDTEGHTMAHFGPNKAYHQILLSGHTPGPLVENRFLMSGLMAVVHWPPREYVRLKAYKQGHPVSPPNLSLSTRNLEIKYYESKKFKEIGMPYAEYVKSRVQPYKRDVYHLLRDRELNLFKEDDRAKARAVIREFIDSQNQKIVGALKVEPITPTIEHASSASGGNQTKNLADCLFIGNTVRMVKEHFGTADNFLHEFGLDPSELDQWKMARRSQEEC